MAFINAFFSPGASGADATAQLAGAQAELDRLLGDRERVLIHGDDEALDAHDAQIAAARRQVERCAAVVASGERQAAEAARRQEEERLRAIEDARQARYDAASDQLKAVLADAPRHYVKACRQVRAVLRQLAEASVAVEAVNADLPPGRAALPHPENMLRQVGERPRQVLKTETVDLWVNVYGRPLSDEAQARVTIEDGRGVIYSESGKQVFTRNRFEKITFLPAVHVPLPYPLAAALVLPALFARDADIWAHDQTLFHPAHVLQKLDATEEALRIDRPEQPDRRVPEVELVRVEDFSPPVADAPSRSWFVPMGRRQD